jgi:hypothetical protein
MSELNGMWRAATKIIDEKNAEIERLREQIATLTERAVFAEAYIRQFEGAPDQPDAAPTKWTPGLHSDVCTHCDRPRFAHDVDNTCKRATDQQGVCLVCDGPTNDGHCAVCK